ncbi:OmpA family protein [Atopomonas sediminilitoris]|uniref:OmpA family protein n=1 Tax=Atopomonas sediminilitoris TaxID=2919919 RepID=UPI001F4E8D1C|nr:OmpA family protein [Atopomonas sediminilitoris]MCJ8170111.1 OmpA family protein [Atopomonas sediminilitoris]
MKKALLCWAMLMLCGCALLPGQAPAKLSEQALAEQRQAQLNAWLDTREAVLREALAGSRLTLERRDDQLLITAPVDASFKRERVMLLPVTLGPLGRMAKLLQEDDDALLLIQSHTDSSGSVALNQQLSEERAKAIASLFYLAGARGKVGLHAVGESQPRHSNETLEGRSANRRVELWLRPREAELMAQQP